MFYVLFSDLWREDSGAKDKYIRGSLWVHGVQRERVCVLISNSCVPHLLCLYKHVLVHRNSRNDSTNGFSHRLSLESD